jgi:pimeloyl-ACP methyl ester carboxylesterase
LPPDVAGGDAQSRPLTIDAAGVSLAGEQAGEGTPVVLLHGLTATRRYVTMGSRALQRSGHRVVAYDARGHGSSSPAPDASAYGSELLARDLLAVLDELGIERAVLVGASMGAHTALRLALTQPERVAGLVLITPSFAPDAPRDADSLAGWDALARGLREDGVDGFVRAYDFGKVPDAMRATIETVLRQRLAAHEHPLAVADALEAVPRSHPFERIDELSALDLPALVVGSRDEADPGHPLAVAERYAKAMPGAQLLIEDPGPPLRSPIAWQGGQLSRAIAELAARVER